MCKRVILHIDMNNFYASVECLLNPSIKNYAVAVAGDPNKRTGIILAKNYLAKVYGVKTGEAIWEAKQKCPTLITVAPHFDKYQEYSERAHKIYYQYTDLIEPFGIDECWLDVTDSLKNQGEYGKKAADFINKHKTAAGVVGAATVGTAGFQLANAAGEKPVQLAAKLDKKTDQFVKNQQQNIGG